MTQKIVIIDYGMGNLFSVQKKLKRLGINPIITSKSDAILAADKIILPGVGHFAKAMNNLKNLNLIEPLNSAVLNKKTPILGICLGMQIMCNKSEEGNANGFGWIDADVVKFTITDTLKHKVPHMGWNTINNSKPSKLMTDIPNDSEFYFVHSYHMKVNDTSAILNETNYEYKFHSAIEKDNIFGVQYHPEKSHDIGEQLFKNFIAL